MTAISYNAWQSCASWQREEIPVGAWYDAIADKTVADAIIDRIVHDAIRIELEGESLRKTQVKKNQTACLVKDNVYICKKQ
uniref:IstB-like ATP-binding domain-containing protein n=1 Tax=Prevotella sp. GTC17262 TaxID=3236797 RepID=A0AB33JGZ1_9BACT